MTKVGGEYLIIMVGEEGGIFDKAPYFYTFLGLCITYWSRKSEYFKIRNTGCFRSRITGFFWVQK